MKKNQTGKLKPFILIISSFFSILASLQKPSFSSPGGVQFQWDPDPSFKRLKSFQTSSKKMDKAFYYFFLRGRSRKTGILKLTIKVPHYFKGKILKENLNLCEAKIGGVTNKTKCLNNISALFEVNKTQKEINVYPDNPIPVDNKTYAVIMKIKNPRKTGMFQFHGYAQSTGAMPLATYMGTWSFDVE